MSEEVQTTEIRRQDLLDMSGLTEKLNKNDLLFITRGGKLDAVMARPSKLMDAMDDYGTDKTMKAIRQRLKQRQFPKPTAHDRDMFRAIRKRGKEATLTQIGNDVQRAISNIHRRIQVLCEREYVERIEEGASITYRLTESGLDEIRGTD